MPKTPSTETEADIQRGILEYLREAGVFHWRQNSGTAFVHGRKMTLGPEGIADVLLVKSGGKLVGMEVKSATGKLRNDQKLWAMKAYRVGVDVYLVRSVGDARLVINSYPIHLNVAVSHCKGDTIESLEAKVQAERERKRQGKLRKVARGGHGGDGHVVPVPGDQREQADGGGGDVLQRPGRKPRKEVGHQGPG